VKPLLEHESIHESGIEPPTWDHSAHIIDFVKGFVEDRVSRAVGSEANTVVSSLRSLLKSLESPTDVRTSSFVEAKTAKDQADPFMPPSEAAVAVLRWAKGSLLTMNKCQDLINMKIRSPWVY